MELQDALTQIAEIRRQLSRTEVFRGYRALPVAFSGLVAFGAAGMQAVMLPEPAVAVNRYLTLWFTAAAVAAAPSVVEMAIRARGASSPSLRRASWLALEQFLPALVAGLLVTAVLARSDSESAWMFPGLWQVCYSLGIFASFRLLPRATFWVAVFYLLSGLANLAWTRGAWELSPWAMALPFGIGQLMAALVLYWTLERGDADA